MTNTYEESAADADGQAHALQESVVKGALEQLDWPALKRHFDAKGINPAGLAFLLGHLRRTTSLIMAYRNAKREAGRAVFLDSLSRFVDDALGPEAAVSISREVGLLDSIERGYRSILDLLERSEMSKLPPEVRVAAYISRAAIQYHLLEEQIREAAQARKEISFPQGPLLITEDQTPIHPDAVIGALVETVTSTLGMEARRNNWLDGEGYVILPQLPAVGDDQRLLAGSTEVLAMYWRRWRRIEERRRFVGGTLDTYVAPDLPPGLPPEARRFTIYRLRPAEMLDYVANERLGDWLGQTFMEMLMETNVQAKAAAFESGATLLPGAFISPTEIHAAESLSEILGYDILLDEERPGGLRLVEWLRGYALLQAVGEQRTKAGEDPEPFAFMMPQDELLGLMVRCGLGEASAKRFLSAASLKMNSRDMFDCPLIRIADGSLLIFVPGVLTANLPAVVLSAISTMGEPLSRKGKAFEAAMHVFFGKQGLRAESFTVHRDGEQYQYDLVVLWREYVFVFECKNHSLSGRQPARAYYFELQAESDGRQVKRLADALTRYPEILRNGLSITPSDKKIVACVLNALPYSRPGAEDGVFFTDASSLKRFFGGRHFNLKMSYNVAENVRVLARTAMHQLWEDEAPTPADLLRHLEDPFQIQLMLAHTEIAARPFAIAEDHLVAGEEFLRTEMTIESYADLVGMSAEAIRKERAEVEKQVERLRAKLGQRAASSRRPV